ncbi:phosphatidylinositol glycan, class O [Pseudohyphozyma bogoriensis]|nr:phosphatidylinositol glycan, class O [Pseudohyphozyma bogoriensis]
MAAVVSLAVVAFLHLSAMAVFSRGFLLSRTALADINDCSPFLSDGNLDASCTLPATHSKLVLVIVDALRADFVLPSFAPSAYHHNLVPLPSTLATSHPTHSFLAHFIADAPTTTLQRLKALTTGSLPTFVDAGSNFGGESILEDNWLAQAKRHGKRLRMVGDDTWLNVFPPSAEGVWTHDQTQPYDSFNVEDLDTVDAGVREGLLAQLDSKTKDWDILIAHGLGLDHAGHRFGSEHNETTRKLRETEQLLEDVVQRLDDDTLLVVMGDHGMTQRGDHGGDSREEVDAAVWIYSKGAEIVDKTWYEDRHRKPYTWSSFSSASPSPSDHPLVDLFTTSATSDDLGDRMLLTWPDKGLTAPSRAISQVDLVPTLSLLLGLPIPFGSLGVPIPELFFRRSALPIAPIPNPKDSAAAEKKKKAPRSLFGSRGGADATPSKRPEESLSPIQTLLQAHLLVASQLEHYLKTYTASGAGDDLVPAMPELAFTLGLAQSAYRGAHAPGQSKDAMELRALTKFWGYARRAREAARKVWARFDPLLMGAGVGLWLGSVVVAVRLWAEARSGSGTRFVVGQGVEGGVLAAWGTAGLALLGAFKSIGGIRPLWFLATVAFGVEVGVFLAPSSSTSRLGAYGLNATWTPRSLVSLLPRVAHAALFASNSFTVFEDSIVLFFLSTILLHTLLSSLAAPESRLRKRLVGFSLLALVCIRLMAYSTICREEQIPRCHATFHQDPASTTAWAVLGAAYVAAWFLPTVMRAFLAISASDEGLAPLFLSVLVRGLLLTATSYWAVDQAIVGTAWGARNVVLATALKTGLARIVLVGSVASMSIVWAWTPLCLRVQKTVVKDKQGGDLGTQVEFIGFANALGSTYLLFIASAFSLLFLVNSPPAQIVLALQVVVLLSLLEIFDSQRDAEHLRTSITSATIADFLNSDVPAPPPSHTGPTFLQISTIALLSHLSFFTTGHQASLSTIQWSTAFIGFPTLVYPFSPALVILNTLSSHFLTALAVPLFVLWNLSPPLKTQPPSIVLRHVVRAGVGYMTYEAVVALSAAFWAAYFRRHLMVWKVFAPRFMVGVIMVLAVDVGVVLGGVGWGVARTLSKARRTLGSVFVE